ncbi:MAG: hypothetical protein F6J98_03110 [Moorea sp. SIO4G2]|nr:hypothetical protein [Moorena sp. SIO4G2]
MPRSTTKTIEFPEDSETFKMLNGRLEYLGDELGCLKEHSESVWSRLEEIERQLADIDGSIDRVESTLAKKMLPVLDRIAVALELIASGMRQKEVDDNLLAAHCPCTASRLRPGKPRWIVERRIPAPLTTGECRIPASQQHPGD